MALFLRICLITIILPQMWGYVLFAANLDDFRSIAKKFIPEKLADQLAEMASESSAKYYQKAEEKDAEYESNESERDDVTTPYSTEVSKAIAKKRYVIKNQIPEVNLDELVEKVRERLLKGKNKPSQKAPSSGKKYKYANQNVDSTFKTPNDGDAANIDYSQNSYEEKADNQEPVEEDFEEVTTKRHKPQIKPEIHVKDDRVTKNYKEAKYYQSVNKDTDPNQNGDDGKIFHEIDLRNTNDSYEDYVTPDKDTIFESKESRISKQRPLRQKTVKKLNIQRSSPKDYDDLKARTESMLYDENVAVSQTIDGVLHNSKSIKKGKGTMIPTREYYKMSSPDYYKKLPVIVEKYNFDEPLPEKDRDPEHFKPIGNPPARINKKVKL